MFAAFRALFKLFLGPIFTSVAQGMYRLVQWAAIAWALWQFFALLIVDIIEEFWELLVSALETVGISEETVTGKVDDVVEALGQLVDVYAWAEAFFPATESLALFATFYVTCLAIRLIRHVLGLIPANAG